MTTRYQKKHYEDVAAILCIGAAADVKLAVSDVTGTLIRQFADLFAADNPGACSCPPGEEHPSKCNMRGGFDRERFLTACGLESEG